MVAAVGIPEEFAGLGRPGQPPAIHVRMLGRLTIWRRGAPLTLPASRKVRALFAYLALAPRPMTRSQLCELLWDVPNDPRGELRWSLSKVRSLVDERGRPRVQTRADTVWLDLSDCLVDAIEVARATGEGIETLPAEPAARAGRAVQRRLPGRPGHRPQPGLRRVAHGPAPPIPRLPRGPAGAPRQARARRRGVPIPGALAPAGALRSARPRPPAERASPGAARSGKARSTWPRPPGCSRAKASTRRRCATPGSRRGRAPPPRRRSGSPLRRCPPRAATPSSSRRLAAPPSR